MNFDAENSIVNSYNEHLALVNNEALDRPVYSKKDINELLTRINRELEPYTTGEFMRGHNSRNYGNPNKTINYENIEISMFVDTDNKKIILGYEGKTKEIKTDQPHRNSRVKEGLINLLNSKSKD